MLPPVGGGGYTSVSAHACVACIRSCVREREREGEERTDPPSPIHPRQPTLIKLRKVLAEGICKDGYEGESEGKGERDVRVPVSTASAWPPD